MEQRQKIALISVYDKTGIADFAQSLANLGWKIISSGGTAKHLSDAGVSVTDVADITGFPAILGHRVVTLHPKIHGGLLALDTPEHLAELEKYDIPWIDLVCVDLYPLEEEIAKYAPSAPGTSPYVGGGRKGVLEKTDMGGVALIRSSAKGRRITICEPSDRAAVLKWLKNGEPNREEFLNDLAAKAEILIARYCSVSGEYHGKGEYKGIFGKKPARLDDVSRSGGNLESLLYGENAYQKPASLYKLARQDPASEDKLAIHNWALVAGSPLSYNNICDLDRMMQTMTHIGAGFEKNFGEVSSVAIGAKHGNACGAGTGESGLDAIGKMLLGDLRAIFGGSVMLNFNVDEKIAEELIHKYAGTNRRLLDVVAAPSFSEEAKQILSRKGGKCRLLANRGILKAGLSALDNARRFRYVRGGFMEQPNYTFVPAIESKDAVLAWAIGSTSNSNTITLVKGGRLYGNGVGQQDRVGAAKLAIFRADEAAAFANDLGAKLPFGSLAPKSETIADLKEAVAYSDSFFPFPDAPEVLIGRGIKTIFSTSGSVNDEKIIELCRTKGVNLIMLPDSEARGFYQH
ncbi:MAG: phosphoribosylaminoimidazolecarboxamide formyltransferase / IMP cyclohydrolase [Parcubacteria group bacterium Gr01-1014_24]|nr:MAG: phosphoribosylaminoimidazolecarboxamide formyltransferase / IMP cyclohydrolase [Parcubacteria group bacterium Gr01-1014_24]